MNDLNQIWIIDESSGSPFLPITDAGFKANGVPEQVVFIDSFFLVTTDSKKFIRSDANNGLSWNALNFFTAEADPDNRDLRERFESLSSTAQNTELHYVDISARKSGTYDPISIYIIFI